MSDDRAVQAAAKALRHYEAIDFGGRAGYTERDLLAAAEAAVAAAREVIEAEAAAKATTWHMAALDDLAACVAERDEARAEVEALRGNNFWWAKANDTAAERDDWRRRYEALRDGVTGLTEDEWGSRADETERCPLCRRKWSKHTDYDGRCYDGASTLAGYIRDLRAVVARVEET